MKERTEKKIALGFVRKPQDVVEDVEQCAEKMAKQGWHFLHSETDVDFKTISLFFERDLKA